MTPQEKIEAIHIAQLERNPVEVVLMMAEYGISGFFEHYKQFLECTYKQTVADLYWDEAYQWYISPYWSQLWRGLDVQPYGQFDEKKYRRNRHRYFDEIRDRSPQEKRVVNLNQIFD